MKHLNLIACFTEKEWATLFKKYGDEGSLKFFLNRQLDKAIAIECESIDQNTAEMAEEESA